MAGRRRCEGSEARDHTGIGNCGYKFESNIIYEQIIVGKTFMY